MKMHNDLMNTDSKMMDDDMMMTDDKIMKEEMMMPAAKTIKVWVGSKKMMVDGMQVSLNSMPSIHEGSTYVSHMVVSKYMMPMNTMK